jgi:phosphoglycerol transferase MdoB-like AlkP superfamily enzyme
MMSGKGECARMGKKHRYLKEKPRKVWAMPLWGIPAAFFLIEVFAFLFLHTEQLDWWPLVFGLLWAGILTGLTSVLPRNVSRIVFGVLYFVFLGYTAAETGYYIMFSQMLWVSEFRYASEGSEFFNVLLHYPIGWWLFLVGLIALGVVLVWRYPKRKNLWQNYAVSGLVCAVCICGAVLLPEAVFQHDRQIQYAGSDYGRAQSAEAAYDNMFNTHRLYRVCGIYQTAVKDVYRDYIYPIMPGYARAQAAARQEIKAYFDARGERQENAMTGLFAGKNVILVLMESMDDFALGAHTPTINRLMDECISFTNFYTPGYGGVRTFNSEFCGNTGSFLTTSGGYAFDYVTNDYRQSLANVLRTEGYSAKVYHYNDPDFYSRGVFSPAMGYEDYVSYDDYDENKQDLYNDQFLFDHAEIAGDFFRNGPKLNFIITRSAHLSYKYNEVLSHYALKQYPEYKGMTGDEELDCMYVKAKLVDDMFARLLQELEAKGELENTVIVAYTDHYAYGFKNVELMLEKSGVEDLMLLEKTPCFIWSADGPDLEVEKTLNTADLLPTVMNLLGVDPSYDYIGQDAFDDRYEGYALFPDGSWVCDGVAYSAATEDVFILQEGKTADPIRMETMAAYVNDFVRINNMILETNYYKIK